jgi:hypothetical protein
MNMKRNEPHLVCYLSRSDIDTAINRIPIEYRKRLREIITWNGSYGVRRLGFVTRRGRRDISLCTCLPPRVSLGRFLRKGQSAKEFGAPMRGQWPPWAIRRFMLYNVLLHELGHLQLVIPKSKNWNRKYASETKAQDFADVWRRKLFMEPFDHSDPIHNPPTDEELSWISTWEGLNKKQRFALVDLVINAPFNELPDISMLGDLEKNNVEFLNHVLCQKNH